MSQIERPPESAITTMAPNGNHVGMEIWPSREWSEWLYDSANVALIVALIAGAVATVMVVWMGNKKEEYLKRDVAAAQLRGDEANAEAAKANARTAELQRDAERLRLELDREIQKRAPRILTDEQKAILVAELRGKVPDINVVVQRDLEAQSFALKLEIAFQEAGARLHPYEMPPGEMLVVPLGVKMYMPGGASKEEDMVADPLYLALKKASLFGGFTSGPFSSPDPKSISERKLLPANQHVVYVGQKPPY